MDHLLFQSWEVYAKWCFPVVVVREIINKVLVITCVVTAPTSAFAYPFYPDPKSFENYMNTVSWADGSKTYFQNLNQCNDNQVLYTCGSGFVTIKNPMGTQICRVNRVTWFQYERSARYWTNERSCKGR